jgi:hypothetical protein
MNPTRHAKSTLATGLFTFALIVAAPHTEAANRCDGPTVGGEARACAAEREGPDALRRFVARTQAIYGLYFWDLRRVTPDTTATRAQTSVQVATSQKAP